MLIGRLEGLMSAADVAAMPGSQATERHEHIAETARSAKRPRGAAGSLSFFDALVEEHHQKIYNLTCRYLGDPEEAFDLTQEVFLRAYQSFEHFRGEATVFTWLYRIALNLCHNRLKQLRRLSRHEQESLDAPIEIDGDQLRREISDWSTSPERLALQSELGRLLQHAINGLSPEHRAVVLLRDIEGLSYAEVAEATGVSLEAVKSRLFRARSQLQAIMEPYLVETIA